MFYLGGGHPVVLLLGKWISRRIRQGRAHAQDQGCQGTSPDR